MAFRWVSAKRQRYGLSLADQRKIHGHAMSLGSGLVYHARATTWRIAIIDLPKQFQRNES
ncbi:MAG: hypothetical protein LBJ37_21890 [Paucimonas sp.]|nr:hypothetical protein [Paucimonas sp.]